MLQRIKDLIRAAIPNTLFIGVVLLLISAFTPLSAEYLLSHTGAGIDWLGKFIDIPSRISWVGDWITAQLS